MSTFYTEVLDSRTVSSSGSGFLLMHTLWEAGDGSSIWVLTIYMGDPDVGLCSWIRSGPALIVVGIWGNEPAHGPSLSAFQMKGNKVKI